MRIDKLLQWQWDGYAQYHRSRINLLIHIVAVPTFLFGTLALIAGVLKLSVVLLVTGMGCIVIAIALQGRGHRLEAVPPHPFTGPLNFVSRLVLEQWVTFPRFVVTGRWSAALRKDAGPKQPI